MTVIYLKHTSPLSHLLVNDGVIVIDVTHIDFSWLSLVVLYPSLPCCFPILNITEFTLAHGITYKMIT